MGVRGKRGFPRYFVIIEIIYRRLEVSRRCNFLGCLVGEKLACLKQHIGTKETNKSKKIYYEKLLAFCVLVIFIY